MTIPHNTHDKDHIEFTDAERNAMRAYLQRCEVRLSTLHRIATSFVGGAGLLLLIPVFFRDVVEGLIEIMLQVSGNQFTELSEATGVALTVLLHVALVYPMMISLVMPLYGVYLLLKDIIHFYYTFYMPGFDENLQNPTFTLSGVMFSIDESPRVKREVMRYQYVPAHMDFMMPFSQGKRELYFDKIIETTKGAIIPPSRNLVELRDLGWLPEVNDPQMEKDMLDFNAALGLARSMDRMLAHEVAISEMSLVRHVTYLRRLVLRYVKTLLLFIWTTLVSFIMLPFLKDERFPTFVLLALGYLVWSLAVIPIVSMPIKWIYRHRYGDVQLEHVDTQLMMLEEGIKKYCYAAVVSSVMALILAIGALL